MSCTLKWGGGAFGQPVLGNLGEQKPVICFEPGEILGRAGVGRPLPKQAENVCDEWVMYLCDGMAGEFTKVIVALARYAYAYFLCVGGNRNQDAMNVNKIEFLDHAVVLTASHHKTSTSGYDERTTIPLLDYRKRSIRPAFEALQSQMSSLFLLADPVATREKRLESPIRLVDGYPRPISYQHITEFLGYMAEDYNKIRSRYDSDNEPQGRKAPPVPLGLSIHSPKGWLDTFAIQAEFSERETDILCHWNAKSMQKHYNKNFCGVELKIRSLVIRLFMTSWRSVPTGQIPLDPPARSSLPPLQVIEPTSRF